MDERSRAAIHKTNFWKKAPENLGLIRDGYLASLKNHLGNNLIKVLVGQRRSGKSYIIKQLIHYLIEEKKVNPQNILYLNLELHDLQFIHNQEILFEVIDWYFEEFSPKGKLYFFFDEIQEILNWEKAIISYQSNHLIDVEIFLTGSNANLLSSDLATYLTGRYIEKEIAPFSFPEYIAYHHLEKNKASLLTYLQDTGLMESYHLNSRELKASYLSALKESILMKDIVRRFSIKQPHLLENLFWFLVDNVANLFSINSLVKKLENCHIKTNTNTLANYLKYLESAFLIQGISRYDLKGKKILEGEKKYYLNDLGFKNYLQTRFDVGLGKNLENYVFNAFRIKGWAVYVGNISGAEIDFILEKNNERRYIQVTYQLQDEKVVEREYGNLEKISDHWPKYVISLDDIAYPPRNGIRHLQAWDLELI